MPRTSGHVTKCGQRISDKELGDPRGPSGHCSREEEFGDQHLSVVLKLRKHPPGLLAWEDTNKAEMSPELWSEGA